MGGHTGSIMYDRVWIIGGINSGLVEQFSPEANSWLSGTPLPGARNTAFAATAAGSPLALYVIGGSDEKGYVKGDVFKGMVAGEGEEEEPAVKTPSTSAPDEEKETASPSSEPEATTPPSKSGGMGCAPAGSTLPNTSLDVVSFSLLGCMVTGLYIASRRTRRK